MEEAERWTLSTYKGSPMSEGEFQHNMWGLKDEELSGLWDWATLRKQVRNTGCETPFSCANANSIIRLKFLETTNVLSHTLQTSTPSRTVWRIYRCKQAPS